MGDSQGPRDLRRGSRCSSWHLFRSVRLVSDHLTSSPNSERSNSAILMLGTNPGMKLATFNSLSKGAWYFVLKYMDGEVGVPVEDPNDEDMFEDTWSQPRMHGKSSRA